MVITVSRHSLADLRVHLNVTNERLRVVWQAVDPLFFGDSSGVMPREMTPGSPFLMAFASADGRKNHIGSISAYREAAKHFAGLRLALVCSHPGVRSALQGIPAEGVLPLGPVVAEELVWLYRNALALVFPSLDEGFGLPPLEAMASGTPVVASGTGSLPEVLGDSAVFVDPHDVGSIAQGIEEVLRDVGLRERLSSRGREHAARFTCERMGRELAGIYEEIAGR